MKHGQHTRTQRTQCLGTNFNSLVQLLILDYAWTAENAASNILIRQLHVRSGERSHLCRSVRTVTVAARSFTIVSARSSLPALAKLKNRWK